MNFLVNFLSIIDAVLVIAVIVTLISDNRRKKEEAMKAELSHTATRNVEPELKAAPAQKAEPVVDAATPAKKTLPAETPRFYGINSVSDIVRLAKNSASGVDEAVLEIAQLDAQVKELNSEIRELRKDGTNASESRRKQLLAQRRNLRNKLDYQTVRAVDLEKSADIYVHLLKRIDGQEVDYRKTERLEEKSVQVSESDIKWLKKKLGIS